MSAVAIFTGLACGTLLAAVGLALWNGFRQVPGLFHAVRALGWLAGALLLIGVLLAWRGDPSHSPFVLRLILMAALAAPPGIPRRRQSSWGSAVRLLPVLILAAAGLFWTSEPADAEVSSALVGPVAWAVAICGGFGARALGEALSDIIAPPSPPKPALSKVEGLGGAEGALEWPSVAAYVLLTLLVGITALVNLWQRGSLWGGSASQSGLAGAWLVWIAARPGPRQRSRLRAGLIVVAASLLIVIAVKYA